MREVLFRFSRILIYPMGKLSLAVVIVSYNVSTLLEGCLRSVARAAAASGNWLSVETLVIDNASTDGSAEMVAAKFPQVRLIAADTNLGFTGANNLAFDTLGVKYSGSAATVQTGHRPLKSTPDFILLLNPDTLVEENALEKMAAFLRDTPVAGAVGAHLSYGDGSFQHGAFRFPGLLQVGFDLLPLAEIPGLRRFLPLLLNSRANGRYSMALWQGGHPFPVDFVLGAALMMRTSALEQVGPLDDEYFMYCEEMDWCLRLKAAGWHIFALPTARVTHLEGQSSRQSPWLSFARLWRSRHRFYHKQYATGSTVWFPAARTVVQTALRLRAWNAQRRFAAGRLTGIALTEELSAYRTVRQIWQ